MSEDKRDYAVLISLAMREEAEVAAAALRADGIDAFVGNAHHANVDWLYTLALGGLPPELRTQGTAMWTLIRNLGGSIGVSIVIASLTNKTIVMHARLAESVTPFNQALADPSAALHDLKTDTGLALMEQLMSQQAAIIAYNNNFKLMMVLIMLAFPLIALVRVQKGGLPAVPAHAVAD